MWYVWGHFGDLTCVVVGSTLWTLFQQRAGLFQMGKHAWQMWISHKKILLKGFSSRQENDDNFEKIGKFIIIRESDLKKSKTTFFFDPDS